MRRRESHLLNLSKVVVRVLVEDDLADGSEWEFAVWPDLGQVKNVVAELFSLLGCHGLLPWNQDRRWTRHEKGTYDEDIPGGVVALLDGLEELLDTIVGVGTSELAGLGIVESLEALLGEDVELSVHKVAILVDELEGVTTVTVHAVVSIRGTTV